MRTFLEGIEAVTQACTLVLLLPAIAVALTARKHAPLAVAGFILGATTLAWAQAAQHWRVEGTGVAVIIAAAVLAASGIVLYRLLPGMEWLGGMAGVFGGAVIGWLWQPCAGPQLSIILNDASDSPLRTAGMMLLYVTGACLLAIVVAALPVALPRLAALSNSTAAARSGLAIVFLFAALMAIGRYDELVGELVRISTA